MASIRVARAFAQISRRAAVAPSAAAPLAGSRSLASLAGPRVAPLAASPLFKQAAFALPRSCPPPVAAPAVDQAVATTPSASKGLATSAGSAASGTGVVEAGDGDLEGLTSKGRIVVDFTATWCPPCKIMGPIFEKLSTKYGDSGIKFLKVDVDDNPESANKFSVSAIPTFCFIQDGKLVDQIRGADPAGLERKIAEFGSK